MQFKFTKIDPSGLKKQLQAMPKRLDAARYLMGQNIAENLQEEVKKRIPQESGWLDIYRDAIKFSYDGKQWFVAGEADVDIDDLSAETTLLNFGSSDKQSQILANYNPWPLDLVPGIERPYGATVEALAAGESEVEARRQELLTQLPSVRANLTKAGFQWNAFELPIFNGRVTADLAFLGQRLELGHGPFKSAPHWKPAVDGLPLTFQKSITKSKDQFESILTGRVNENAKRPSSDVKTMFQNAVRQQVPKLS